MSYKNKKTQVKSNDTNKPKESFLKRLFSKEIGFFSSLGEKSRKLVSNEPNFIIFLIMTFTLSLMYEKTGLSRTFPLILIIPFLIGTFYGRRKATMLHMVVASIILGTVSGDVAITSTVIIVGTICTFSGLYLSKFLENLKKYNIFNKIFKLLVAGFLCVFSFVAYSYYFGVPTDYLKAKKAIESQDIVNVEKAIYEGITYNPRNRYYDALYTVVADDLSYEEKYLISYDIQSGTIVYNNDDSSVNAETEETNNEENIKENEV